MPNKFNVCIVGKGGREHALGWKIRKSSFCGDLFFTPGNAGTASVGTNAAVNEYSIHEFARKNNVRLTVIGPEANLAKGIVDYFQQEKLSIFGPTIAAARIETSKVFAKLLMASKGIPTAPFYVFDDLHLARLYVREHGAPIVIKVDGLASGKGVFPCSTTEEAEQALKAIFTTRSFGDAGKRIIVESFLAGRELSIHALCDGTTAMLLATAQDYKRLRDGGAGPNTGGMGAIAPVPWINREMLATINRTIVQPALDGLAALGTPFRGLLYPGLMIHNGTAPYVLEYNCRFGDPETQALMPLLSADTDLLETLLACAEGSLGKHELSWDNGTTVCVVLASPGYPEKPETGSAIEGISDAEQVPGVTVFHAGTATEDKGGLPITAGGRVLSVVAKCNTIEDARTAAYEAVSKIHFPGMQFRTDIGRDF